MGSFNGNYAKYKRTLFVSDELAQAKNCRGAFGYVTYGNTIEQTSMGSYLESFGGVEKLYEKIGNKWVEAKKTLTSLEKVFLIPEKNVYLLRKINRLPGCLSKTPGV